MSGFDEILAFEKYKKSLQEIESASVGNLDLEDCLSVLTGRTEG